eukprot:CFRG4504T1
MLSQEESADPTSNTNGVNVLTRADSDTDASENTSEKETRPKCKSGLWCKTTKVEHMQEFWHPDKRTKLSCRDYLECKHIDQQWHTCFYRHISRPTNSDLLLDTWEKFPDPFDDSPEYESGIEPYTRKEIEVLKMMQAVACKSRWRDKIRDPKIYAKWKAEMMQQAQKSNDEHKEERELPRGIATSPVYIHETMIEWALSELLYVAENMDEKNKSLPTGVPMVYQSDNAVSQELCDELKHLVKKLEDVPECNQDWHPGTNKQVLDLIHPSLFCFVSNLSRVTEQPMPFRPRSAWLSILGAGVPQSIPASSTDGEYKTYSDTYQWLPSDITVSEDGKEVKFNSYINNLHPYHHEKLYNCLEKIVACFIPMWESVLTDLQSQPERRDKIDMYDLYEDFDESDSDADEDEYYDTREPVIPVEMGTFEPKSGESLQNKVNLGGRNLQVIVKMANTLLSAENPEFDGGHWHVEGMENENIVATGIYYYQVDDTLAPSQLMFRQACCEPNYEQGDEHGVGAVFGLADEEALVQELGAVSSIEKRCVAFPNILQHRVPSFKLKNDSGLGEGEIAQRKILVFFLIDPTRKITSTAVVPPQQKEWLGEEIMDMEEVRQFFPPEVVGVISDKMEWPMSMEVAKEHRDKLMHERKYFTQESTNEYFLRPFSLCEH